MGFVEVRWTTQVTSPVFDAEIRSEQTGTPVRAAVATSEGENRRKLDARDGGGSCLSVESLPPKDAKEMR